ncbi:MAG: hypothetical protein UEU47_05910 [Oscillospiraceae bacterium]|nr:hypothetical protein [Oscillospiraceae bacterium]
MNAADIKSMIERYQITDCHNGNIGIYNTKGITQEEVRTIKAAKPEILAYFAAEREAQEAEQEWRRRNFEAIEGLVELRDARAARAKWQREFNRIMERGDSIFPAAPTADVKALETKYPAAVFALSMEQRNYGSNYELAAMAKRAYDALCDGQDWQEVKATYDAENSAFTERHSWD